MEIRYNINMQLVWLKRDLRLHDHQALHMAANNGPFILLYIFEPDLWREPDMSLRHYDFLLECLEDLATQVNKKGGKLVVKVGDAETVLDYFYQKYQIQTLISHQETWNHWTFKRDITVQKWCKKRQIEWLQPIQNGVIRALKDRDGWAKKWDARMTQPMVESPATFTDCNEKNDKIPSFDSLSSNTDACSKRLIGTRKQAELYLHTFLYERGEHYTKEMSSPITAFDACSRLSVYLAFGVISIKEVYQTMKKRQQELWTMPKSERGSWLRAISSFSGRLHWHCHFIQKLESEPRIEFENLHPAYNGLRPEPGKNHYLESWKEGKTGYPFVDACMRCLKSTGWLNFRMRAMLVSFASNHLWLHWRQPSLYLAQLFLDYEPGIHYSQFQMQSGTTGINTIRIYSPIKQSMDQDPNGLFIKEWVPELKKLDKQDIHTPWLMETPPDNYPPPIVDEKIARKYAADQLYGLRKNNSFKQKASSIVKKHASRKS